MFGSGNTEDRTRSFLYLSLRVKQVDLINNGKETHSFYKETKIEASSTLALYCLFLGMSHFSFTDFEASR